MAFSTDNARWRAVATRDPAADGVFIYGVTSTRIFCRPVCNARLARRANIVFFDTKLQAETAGFRACKRCKPELVKYDPLEDVLKSACAVIESALDPSSKSSSGKVTLKEIAQKVNLTPRYLHKVFKDRMGCTPKQYAESVVAGRATRAGSSPSVSGTSTKMETGYLTPSTSDGTWNSDEDLLASVMDLVDWDYNPDTDSCESPTEEAQATA